MGQEGKDKPVFTECREKRLLRCPPEVLSTKQDKVFESKKWP